MNTNTLGFIRLSSYGQVTSNTKKYHKENIMRLIKDNNLNFIDWFELNAVSGRKEDNIDLYMSKLKWMIQHKDIKYIIATEMRNFGRLSFETGFHIKDIVCNYHTEIITKTMRVNEYTFNNHEERLRLLLELLMCEVEGYRVVNRTTEGKKQTTE